MKSAVSYLLLSLFVLALFTTACNNGSGGAGKDSTLGNSFGDSVGAEMENVATGVKGDLAEMKNKNADSSFIATAMAGNNKEISLLQLGVQKGSNVRLKGDAHKMLADHTKLKAELQDYSSKKNVKAPAGGDIDKTPGEMQDTNNNKTGRDWDEAWVEKIISEHKDDIDVYEKGERNVKDSALHTIITNTLPLLRSHLAQIQELQKIIRLKEKG